MSFTTVFSCHGWWRECAAYSGSRSGARGATGEAVVEQVGALREVEEEPLGNHRGCDFMLDQLVEDEPSITPEVSPLREGRARAKTVDIQQIQKDIPRTFFDQPDVLRLASVIEAVLQQYAAADTEVGYCQGMSFVAAVTAFQFRTAETAFEEFWAVVSRIRGLWLPGLPLLLTGVTAFELLCKSCFEDLEPCLGANDVTLDMFLPDAWLTLFSRWLPFSALWDSFEFVKVEGFPGVLAITLALLKAHKSALFEADNFKDMFVVLKELAKQPQQPDVKQLLTSARELVPKAHTALAEATAPLAAQRTTSTLTRCGPCIVHAKSGVELLDCGGWPTLAGTLQAISGKAVGRDNIFGVFRMRSDTPTAGGSTDSLRALWSTSLARLTRRKRRSCLCGGKAPREDA